MGSPAMYCPPEPELYFSRSILQSCLSFVRAIQGAILQEHKGLGTGRELQDRA